MPVYSIYLFLYELFFRIIFLFDWKFKNSAFVIPKKYLLWICKGDLCFFHQGIDIDENEKNKKKPYKTYGARFF